jgi:hypothetical protein
MAYTPKFKPGDTIGRISNPTIQIFITRYGQQLTDASGNVYGYDPNDGVYEGYQLPATDPLYLEYWTASGIDAAYDLVSSGSNTLLWIAGGVGAAVLLLVLLKK